MEEENNPTSLKDETAENENGISSLHFPSVCSIGIVSSRTNMAPSFTNVAPSFTNVAPSFTNVAPSFTTIKTRNGKRRRKLHGDPVYNEARLEIEERQARLEWQDQQDRQDQELHLQHANNSTGFVDQHRNISARDSFVQDIKRVLLLTWRARNSKARSGETAQALCLAEAKMLRRRRNVEAAVKYLEQGLRMRGTIRQRAAINLELSKAFMDQNKWMEAMQAADLVLAHEPSNLDAMGVMGEALLQQGDYEHSMVLFWRGWRLAAKAHKHRFQASIHRCVELIRHDVNKEDIFGSGGILQKLQGGTEAFIAPKRDLLSVFKKT